jgi:uncharacterized protein (DUF3820 family)
MMAESTPDSVHDIDPLQEVVHPVGDDKFLSRAITDLFHPKNYLAWFRSTQPTFQQQAIAALQQEEMVAAQHAFLVEVGNIIEDKLELLECPRTPAGESPSKKIKFAPPAPLKRSTSAYVSVTSNDMTDSNNS